MSLREFQAALARLYLDASIRAAVLEGDRAATAELDLSDAEFENLRRLLSEKGDRVELLAKTLKRKRVERINAFYSALSHYLGAKRWNTILDEHFAKHPTPVTSTPAADASALASYLRETVEPGYEDDEVLADLLALEGLAADVAAQPILSFPSDGGLSADTRPLLNPPACVHMLRRPPEPLRAWVARGAVQPIDVQVSPKKFLFYRRAGFVTASVAELSPNLALVLERADGATTIAEFANQIALRSNPDDTFAEVLRALAHLGASGVVSLRSSKERR